MNRRRRFTRYVPDVPLTGCARLVSDCIVEEWLRDSAVVVTNQPARCDEEFLLQLTSPSGAMTLRPVRVLSSAPDSRHGPLRFRLHVQLISDVAAPAQDAPTLSPLTRGSDQ
jgi:hypothetical protein